MKKAFLFLVAIALTLGVQAQKKGKSKKNDKKTEPAAAVNYDLPEPVLDTAKQFTGIIKYRITTNDPADRDSMFIIFGHQQLAVVMFTPGYRADQVFEQHFQARFSDSMLLVLEPRNKTYKMEPLSARNAGTEFSLLNYKKSATVMGINCPEYKGQMTLADGDAFEAAALVSNQHQFAGAMDYNFFNIQPVVIGYRIVLGWRTKTPDNESTFIMAYKIEPGPVESYFDLSGYTLKK